MRDGKEGDGGERFKYGETVKVIVQARVDEARGRELERQGADCPALALERSDRKENKPKRHFPGSPPDNASGI